MHQAASRFYTMYQFEDSRNKLWGILDRRQYRLFLIHSLTPPQEAGITLAVSV